MNDDFNAACEALRVGLTVANKNGLEVEFLLELLHGKVSMEDIPHLVSEALYEWDM